MVKWLMCVYTIAALEKPNRVEEVDGGDSDSPTSVHITWDVEDAAPTYQVSTSLKGIAF